MTTLASTLPTATGQSMRPRIRLLAIMEGSTVSGPAKNLLEFFRIVREMEEGPIIEPTLLLFERTSQNGSTPGPNELMQQAQRDEIPVHCIPERFTFDRQVVGHLKKIVDQVAPDIIQTHMFKSHFLVRACGLNKNRSWVAFFHGYTTTTLKRDLLAQLDRWSLRAPSQVVAVSDSFARALTSARGIPSERIIVLHNAIDPGWMINSPEVAPLVAPGEKLVLAVGRLSKEKGFPDLVAAIGHLKQTNPSLAVKLVIVGEGLERPVIEDAIRRAGLEQQIKLVGHVIDVRPYYRATDVLAISSLSEGSPNALLEAMAAGVPVVSTAVGGVPEIVTHGETALLVSPQDPVALANAIQQLLTDGSLAEKMASRAQELIHSRYSPQSRAQSLVRLYERLCLPISAMRTSAS
jgi:glycosyltransferase involved in cell wall biosynthesis